MADDTHTLPKSRKEALAAGSKHFFTGKPCKRGHIAKRTTGNGTCVVCASEASRKWVAANPERSKANKRRHYDANIDKIKERAKVWRADNLEQARASLQKRRNTPEGKAARKEYRERPEVKAYQKAYMTEWYSEPEHKARSHVSSAEERARKFGKMPSWHDQEREAILALYTEAATLSATTGIPREVDHIIPLRHDEVCGLHTLANLRIITRRENRAKNNRFTPG